MQQAAPDPAPAAFIKNAWDRAAGAVGQAWEASARGLAQDAQRRHEFRMKHGHPPPGQTGPALIRAATAVTITAILALAAVAITAMTVYQDQVITFIASRD